MALEYHTGFDMVPTTSVYVYLKQLGWTHTDAGAGSLSTSVVRNGTRALQLNSSGFFVNMTGLANAATRVLGFGLYVNSLAGGSRGVAAVGDGGQLDTAGNVQIALALDATGHLQVRRGSAIGTAR